MTLAFWSAAALLLAGALLFVLPPLLRADSRPLAPILAVALVVPAGALALYGLLGQPAALAPATAQAANANGSAHNTMTREQMEEMVERLADKLKKQPDDGDGWHMLARSYVAFNRLPEAVQSFERAQALKPRDAQVLADYADTLAMLNGRNLEGRPAELIKAALQLEPLQPKALALAGTAAFNRGDFPAAVATWQKLLDSLPPDSDQARSIAGSIQQAKAQGAAPPAAAAQGGSFIEGSVTVSDALKARIPRGAQLFVFARAIDGPRMPLAIVKVPAGDFPFAFRLDDSQAMSPQLKLSGQGQVTLAARISASGNATPQSGDLMGTLGPVKTGTRGVKLVIDGVVP